MRSIERPRNGPNRVAITRMHLANVREYNCHTIQFGSSPDESIRR